MAKVLEGNESLCWQPLIEVIQRELHIMTWSKTLLKSSFSIQSSQQLPLPRPCSSNSQTTLFPVPWLCFPSHSYLPSLASASPLPDSFVSFRGSPVHFSDTESVPLEPNPHTTLPWGGVGRLFLRTHIGKNLADANTCKLTICSVALPSLPPHT